MLLASSVSGLFKLRQFEPEVILLAVGWYLRFSLSYRDVEELLAERGLHADHVTVWRWVQRYAPEMGRRLRSRLRPTNDSWRVGETYIRVKGKWVYLYRAVDSSGATIDFLPSTKRDATAAERFLAKALGGENISGAAGHQHRRARRLSTGHRAAQSRGVSEGELPASPGPISQQRSGTGSSGDQAPDTRKPAFSLVLGSLAHDRRLRSDPYDPQRPSVRKHAGGQGRSTPLLHSWFVQRGDGLVLRTLSPNFALTPKLQHYPLTAQCAFYPRGQTRSTFRHTKLFIAWSSSSVISASQSNSSYSSRLSKIGINWRRSADRNT